MGVGGGPGVAQDAGYGGGRGGEALVRRVGGRRGDADDGGGEILFPAVQLQVTRLSVQTGTTEETNTQTHCLIFNERKDDRTTKSSVTIMCVYVCGGMEVVLMCRVSSSWTLPRLTDTVELASLMAALLRARRGQQPVELFCAPCWLDREVLRLVL